MNAPTPAYIGASWAVTAIGILAYLSGLWNAEMLLNEKGYYFVVLLFGLYSAISLQKTIRDRAEGIPTTNLYYGISWFALISSVALVVIGLFNANLALSEKGFYMMAFTMSLFGVITIQKNIRDVIDANKQNDIDYQENKQIEYTENEQSSSFLQSPFRRKE